MSEKRKINTYPPKDEDTIALQSIMKRHGIRDKAEGVRYAIVACDVFEEQNASDSIETLEPSSLWKDIHCPYLDLDGKKGECLNPKPYIRIPRKLKPEHCQLCNGVELKQAQETKALENLNVSGKKRGQVAQVVVGLQTQYDAARQDNEKLKSDNSELYRRIDALKNEVRNLKTSAESLQTREKEISEKKREIENIDRKHAEMKTDLEQLDRLRSENDSLKSELGKLELSSNEAKKTIENLESQLKEVKQNPIVLCPDGKSERLQFCVRQCLKCNDCSMYQNNYDLSRSPALAE